MSAQDQNIEIVKKGYQAFSAGDVETMMRLFDDNIVWVEPGNSAISGTYHGKGELEDFFSKSAEKGWPTVKLLRFLADGDMVVVFSEATRGDETTQAVEVYTLRDGKPVRAQVYTDTALLERVYGKKQVAAG